MAPRCWRLASQRASSGMPELLLLVIDDEPQVRRVIRNALAQGSTTLLEAATGREGIDLAAARQPDLIILDLGLPDMPGAAVCREIRTWSAVPIVVLSARHADHEKVTLLDLGADDYITKPFSTVEFQARVRANLRRAGRGTNEREHTRVTVGDLVIDLVNRTVERGGAAIHLTPIEWDLLRTLATNTGRTLTHQQLFSQVWNRAHGDAQQNLRVHIANLRRKLERDSVRPQLIITEPGAGYRFEGS